MVIAAVLMSSITCDRSTSAGFNFLARKRARHEIEAEQGSLWVTGTEKGGNQCKVDGWQGQAALTLD